MRVLNLSKNKFCKKVFIVKLLNTTEGWIIENIFHRTYSEQGVKQINGNFESLKSSEQTLTKKKQSISNHSTRIIFRVLPKKKHKKEMRTSFGPPGLWLAVKIKAPVALDPWKIEKIMKYNLKLTIYRTYIAKAPINQSLDLKILKR